jgi:hypothetical protein
MNGDDFRVKIRNGLKGIADRLTPFAPASDTVKGFMQRETALRKLEICEPFRR